MCVFVCICKHPFSTTSCRACRDAPSHFLKKHIVAPCIVRGCLFLFGSWAKVPSHIGVKSVGVYIASALWGLWDTIINKKCCTELLRTKHNYIILYVKGSKWSQFIVHKDNENKSLQCAFYLRKDLSRRGY